MEPDQAHAAKRGEHTLERTNSRRGLMLLEVRMAVAQTEVREQNEREPRNKPHGRDPRAVLAVPLFRCKRPK